MFYFLNWLCCIPVAIISIMGYWVWTGETSNREELEKAWWSSCLLGVIWPYTLLVTIASALTDGWKWCLKGIGDHLMKVSRIRQEIIAQQKKAAR